MSGIYLDNSATTPLCEEAKAAMRNVMDNIYGNPSSLHAAGLSAERIVTDARHAVLDSLGIHSGDDRDLLFCGSGSEANNLALIGCWQSKKRRPGARIITTAGEHSSTEAALQYLATQGADVVRLSTKGGEIDFAELAEALTKDTVLVSIMLVNNETGAIYPVKEIFETAKRLCPDVTCHCDAVQAYMKVKFSPRSLGADLLTISAHKIHGPKGVAALYVSPEVRKRRTLSPIIHGGQQEFGLRAGTENTVGIAGFGAAAKVAFADFEKNADAMRTVSDSLLKKLAALPEVRVNRPRTAVPYIIHLTLPQIKSETMLHYLSGRGIYVSSGSACSSHAKSVSRALSAFGISDAEADCSLRVSLSRENTLADADTLCHALAEGLSSLVRIK